MRKQFQFFFLITLFIGSFFLYIGFRLIGLTNSSSPFSPGLRGAFWFLLLVPTVMIWLLPTIFWQRENEGSAFWEKAFVWLSSLSIGFMSFLLTFTVTRDVILLILLPFRTYLFTWLVGIEGRFLVFGLSLACLITGVFRALGRPFVNKVTIPIKNLHKDLVGLKIAQISDLHVGVTIQKNYVEQVVQIINSLGADIIAITGDLIDGTVKQLKEHVRPLGDLKAVFGVYYITGNHEYYWGAAEWIKEMTALGAIALLNSNVRLKVGETEVMMAGVVDFAAKRFEKDAGPDLGKALFTVGAPNPRALKILLAHQPKISQNAADAGFDLQLSGHTHGGQFLPWNFVASFFHRFFKGLGRCGEMWVFVNQGTGSWGPPVRLGTSTEISLLTLSKAVET